MNFSTGVFDKNGKEIGIGDIVRESHVLVVNGKEIEAVHGVVKYVRGCHVIDFGNRGTYTLFNRYPEDGRIQNRVWEVMNR